MKWINQMKILVGKSLSGRLPGQIAANEDNRLIVFIARSVKRLKTKKGNLKNFFINI